MVNQHWSIEVLSLPINKVTITNTTQHSKLSSVDLLTESIQTSLQGNPKSFSEPTTQQTSFTKALYIQQRPIPKSSFQRLYKKTPTSLLNIPSQAFKRHTRPPTSLLNIPSQAFKRRTRPPTSLLNTPSQAFVKLSNIVQDPLRAFWMHQVKLPDPYKDPSYNLSDPLLISVQIRNSPTKPTYEDPSWQLYNSQFACEAYVQDPLLTACTNSQFVCEASVQKTPFLTTCTNSQFACEASVQKPLRQYEPSTGILGQTVYSTF